MRSNASTNQPIRLSTPDVDPNLTSESFSILRDVVGKVLNHPFARVFVQSNPEARPLLRRAQICLARYHELEVKSGAAAVDERGFCETCGNIHRTEGHGGA